MDIRIDGVTARIGDKVCLSEISLRMGAGEQWAVLGANASGKTALGRLLCDELEVVAGTLQVPAHAAYVAFETIDAILEVERYNDDTDFLDYVDQGTLVREFILAGHPGAASELEGLALQLGFDKLLARGLRFLSTGEMRKVVICRALLQSPELLVLDEPYDGLDTASRAVVEELVQRLTQRGVRIVLLLNRFSEIHPCITHLAYLRAGTLFAHGPRQELLQSAALRRFHAFHYILPERLPETDPVEAPAPLPADEPLIDMRDVVVRYDGRIILNNLNWSVYPDQHWQISGPNGSGKSTLLSLVCGDNPQAYANRIRLFGRQRGTGESVWDIKRRIGQVSAALQQNYTVGVTAELAVVSGFFDSIGVYRQVTRRQREIARQWLEILHMQDRRNVPLRRLSYGEQRLVLLARAMVKQPRLLILDEPCQGLDEINREMVLKLVDHLGRHGSTRILYVTHHAEDRVSCIRHCMEMVPAAGGGYTGQASRRD